MKTIHITLDHTLSEKEEEYLMERIREDAKNIFECPIVTERMVLEAVKYVPRFLKCVENPTDRICRLAVRRYPQNIRHLKNPSEKLCLLAVETYSDTIFHIDNPSDTVILKAIEKKHTHVELLYSKYKKINPDGSETLPSEVQDQLDEAYLVKLRRNPLLLQEIKTPSDKVILECVKLMPSTFEYVKRPSAELKMKALEANLEVFPFIPRKSTALIVKAVSQDGLLIRHLTLHQRTVDICMLAIEQNPEAVQYCRF